MKQKVQGGFRTNFCGIPLLLYVSTTTLTSEKGSIAKVYTLHITPFIAVGFVRPSVKAA